MSDPLWSRIEPRREGDHVGRTKRFGIFNRRTYRIEKLRSGYSVWRLVERGSHTK